MMLEIEKLQKNTKKNLLWDTRQKLTPFGHKRRDGTERQTKKHPDYQTESVKRTRSEDLSWPGMFYIGDTSQHTVIN